MRVGMDGCFIRDSMMSSQIFNGDYGDGHFVPGFNSIGNTSNGNSHNNNESESEYSRTMVNNWSFNSVMDNNGFSDGMGITTNNMNGVDFGTQSNWQTQLYNSNNDNNHHQVVSVVTTNSGVLIPPSSNGYFQVTPQNAETIMGTSQGHMGVSNSSSEQIRLHSNSMHYGSNNNVPVTSSPGTSVKHYQLRTDLKMQLQRDKALNEKRREESSGRNIGSSLQSSNPVNIQMATTPLQVVSQPGQNVNKGSVLANPTLYHLQEKAKAEGGGKMGRYSNACGGGGSVPPGYVTTAASAVHNIHGFNSLGAPSGKVALHGSAPPNVYSGIDSVPASPLHPESVRSVNSVTSGCSDNTSEYPTNDDLLNEGLGTIQLTDVHDSKSSVASLPPQFPSGGGTTGRGHFGESRLRVKGSSSATARSAPTATDQISPDPQDKDRKKKDNHNKIEQKRRKKINECIYELSTLLPRSSQDEHFEKVGELKSPISKGAVLTNTVVYVKELKKENTDVKKKYEKSKQDLLEARSELQKYKEICQSKGVFIPLVETQIKQEPVPFEDKTFLSCDLQLLEPWPMDHDQDVFQGSGNVMLGGGQEDPALSRAPSNDLNLINENMEFT